MYSEVHNYGAIIIIREHSSRFSLYTEGKYMGTINSVCGSSLSVSYKSDLFFFCTEWGYTQGLWGIRHRIS